MEEHQIGWIAAIIIGGIAGWLAEQFMKSVGAAVANWLSASSVLASPAGSVI